jgi:hypothetical protein
MSSGSVRGSTSKQGWYLFMFLVGFTLGPAGLVGLGWPIALVGFGLLAASFAGFRSIRDGEPAATASDPLPVAKTVKSY